MNHGKKEEQCADGKTVALSIDWLQITFTWKEQVVL